ncbi:hypothetical protein [Pedobacter aquatilis]|uniref:hypothetical protein n=1 Tax=Pedobacter aquatilis TaxID=351343 RepID=UPI00292FD400|nr:hypothetical protein [Pedobacter aquatilis]
MKKIYLLFFLSFFVLLSVSAKAITPVISNLVKSLPKEDLEKEKIETSDEEGQETGTLKTTEFILNQFCNSIFLRKLKITYSNHNIFLPTTYFKVAKQPPKKPLFFE